MYASVNLKKIKSLEQWRKKDLYKNDVFDNARKWKVLTENQAKIRP